MSSYDPLKVSVVVGGVIMQGFADGTMVEAEYAVNQNNMHIGTTGQGRHITSRNRSGSITIRLADYSPSNDALQLIHEVGVPVPILVEDKTTSNGLVFAEEAKVQKLPNFSKGDEAVMNEWVFDVIRMNIVHSGDKDA